MARKIGSAIAYTAGLKNVVKRCVAGDALRLDPQRPRSDLFDLGLSELSASTAIADFGMTQLVANHVTAASRLEMFVLCQNDRVRDADAPATSIGAADLPQSAYGL
jgi:hypothetical protein